MAPVRPEVPSAERRPVRAVFLDLDGTLVSFRDHRVPDSARRALMTARERGVLLFTATGRHRLYLNRSDWMGELEFAGHVTLNGQCCYRADGTPVYRSAVPRESILTLLRRLEKTPQPCYFLEEDHGYLNYMDERVAAVHASIGSPLPELGDVRRALERDVFQVVVYARPEEAAALLQELKGVRHTQWHDNGFDLLPAGGDKWIGIQRMLQDFALEAGEVAAFGDGENDLEMLRRVGWSVAMGGAPAPVRAAAAFVTQDVEDHGILHAFQHYLGIA